jgi:DNA-binding transcriptional ArsR family regulator
MKVCTINENNWKIEFTYSPLFEMLCSMHVLTNSKHHLDRIAWAEEMKSSMQGAFYEELVELGKVTCDFCVIMDLCNLYEACDDFNVIASLDFIEDLNIAAFTGVFQKYKELNHINFDSQLQKSMVRILKQYYLIYFERELRFIEPLLIRSIKRDSEVCSRDGVLNYVNKLHSRIEVTEGAFLFHKFTLFTVPFNTVNRIIIRVSSFISPHLLMDYSADMVQFTTVTCLDKKVEKVPIDLLKLMKALSDETRLKIIRKIYKRKVSTQSLAKELNLTEACISKHLKMLYDAELLYKERNGNYIYYYLNSFFIDRIPLGIYEYLYI